MHFLLKDISGFISCRERHVYHKLSNYSCLFIGQSLAHRQANHSQYPCFSVKHPDYDLGHDRRVRAVDCSGAAWVCIYCSRREQAVRVPIPFIEASCDTRHHKERHVLPL